MNIQFTVLVICTTVHLDGWDGNDWDLGLFSKKKNFKKLSTDYRLKKDVIFLFSFKNKIILVSFFWDISKHFQMSEFMDETSTTWVLMVFENCPDVTRQICHCCPLLGHDLQPENQVLKNILNKK